MLEGRLLRLMSIAIVPLIIAALSLFSAPIALASTPAHTLDNPGQGLNYTVSNNTMPVGGTLVLTLVIGFGLVLWGMRPHEYHWMFMAGFFWIVSSIVCLLDYGLAWMVMGLAIGLTVIIEGAVGLGLRGGD